MRYEGLQQVENPSALFLSDRDQGSPGTAVFAGMEGTRPILVEIQALVAPSLLSMPRRAVVGWDPNRLAMLIAVLEARCGTRLGAQDVYLNVAGGLKLGDRPPISPPPRRCSPPSPDGRARRHGLFRRGEPHRGGEGRGSRGPAP
jgi:predicted ATP-dependent serine protease